MLDCRQATVLVSATRILIRVPEESGRCEEAAEAYRPFEGVYFRHQLLAWGTTAHLRDFPWRHTKDPYCLLLCELMLRRTQARQVVPVFAEFFGRWPSLPDFLEADTEEISRVVWPLGLQWRTQNLLQVRDALQGRAEVPTDYQSLLGLPGVGDYVASAVVVFSERAARPLIDTNTVRVIARYIGMPFHQGTRRLKAFRRVAESLVPATPSEAALYHYSLLDLAAAVCKPGVPLCEACPLATRCRSSRLKELHN